MKLISFFFFLFISCFGLAEEPIPLSFQSLKGLPDYLPREIAVMHLKRELAVFEGQLVQIKGFPHKMDEKNWVLAAEPNLKTCCVGTQQKVGKQIFLSSAALEDHANAVTLIHGRFVIDPQWDDKGFLKQLYRIDDAKIVIEATSSGTFFAALSLALAFAVLVWLVVNKKRNDSLELMTNAQN